MLINSITAEELAEAHFFFNHIPKTGGTSLIDLFKELLGEERCFRHKSRDPKVGSGPPLESLSDKELVSYRFLAGHLPFSAANRLKALGRKVYHITVVRDPIERLVSDYFYNLRQGREDLRKKVRSMSLDAYAGEKLQDPNTKLVHNGQCWFVGDARAFEPAARNIEQHFLAACTTDQLDRMQAAIARLFGVELATPLRSNLTIAVKNASISPSFEGLVRTLSADDLKLLDFVRARFDSVSPPPG